MWWRGEGGVTIVLETKQLFEADLQCPSQCSQSHTNTEQIQITYAHTHTHTQKHKRKRTSTVKSIMAFGESVNMEFLGHPM